jgi:hypothetical protein
MVQLWLMSAEESIAESCTAKVQPGGQNLHCHWGQPRHRANDGNRAGRSWCERCRDRTQ